MFMRPGQTPEQREKVINDISKLFSESGIIEFKKKTDKDGNVVKDANGQDVYERDESGDLVIGAVHFDEAGEALAKALPKIDSSIDEDEAARVAAEVAITDDTKKSSSGGSSGNGDAATETTLKDAVMELRGLREDIKGQSTSKPASAKSKPASSADSDPPS